jgi:hypothetical protein
MISQATNARRTAACHIDEDARLRGRAWFQRLARRNPSPFPAGAEFRRLLRTISVVSPAAPEPGMRPWRMESFREYPDQIVFSCRADPEEAEHYIGFLEALVAYAGQNALICTRTLPGRLSVCIRLP